jgi:hypothetical protein
MFDDTEVRTVYKLILPHWGDLFSKINQEYYLEFIPHTDLDIRMLDDGVFPNIMRSYLHMVSCQTPVLPCIETIGWIIDHTDTMKCIVNHEEGKYVGFFLPVEVQKNYMLKYPEERLNTKFLVKLYEFHDTSRLLASWWKLYRKFNNRRNGWYNMVNLREPYIYLMVLICRLYGEKDCSKFSEEWIPLAYPMTISDNSFNWDAIISK